MSLSRFPLIMLALVALVACSDEAATQATPSANPVTAAAAVSVAPAGYPDRILGVMDAPVTVVEYASLTCIHCANFHTQVLPTVKAGYIDSGKVRWIFRDFPLDQMSLSGAQLSRCLPDATYFRFVGMLFENRDRWLRTDGDLGPLKQLAALAGMDVKQAELCLADTRLRDALLAERLRATNTFKVEATPTVFINDQPYTGAMTPDAFGAALDAAVAAAAPARP